MKKTTVAIVVLVLMHHVGFTQSINSEAFSDFVNDPDFPAFNEEMIMNIKGTSVAGYAFIANGKEPKETILMVHGLPGNDNQFDIAQSLRRTGRNVIHFNYRGTWGSEGDFLYSKSLEDVDEVIKYLSNAENSKRLRIDVNAFTILGRSYGGGIALIKGSTNKRVKKIIAISSLNAGSRFTPFKDISELSTWENYLDRQVMLNVNASTFLQEMLDNKEKFDVVTYKDQLKKKEVLIIEDTPNNQSWINSLENIDHKMIESDHNFISNRIELTTVIIDWLNNN